MKIFVLLKQTFDTEDKIVIENGLIKDEDVNYIINPYDEYAVEEALKIKEQFGAEVTVISVGAPRVEEAMKTALAMGADQGLLIEHEEQSDESVIAHLIAAALKDKEFDLILGGNMAVDSGAGQVAIRVAEMLDIPHVSSITKLTLDGRNATVERDAEGDTEIIEVGLPLLATAQQGLNEPRYPSLAGIMKAKKKPLVRLSAHDLGLPPEALSSKAITVNQYLPQRKQHGKVLTGDLSDQAKQLVQLLRQEAKVI